MLSVGSLIVSLIATVSVPLLMTVLFFIGSQLLLLVLVRGLHYADTLSALYWLDIEVIFILCPLLD